MNNKTKEQIDLLIENLNKVLDNAKKLYDEKISLKERISISKNILNFVCMDLQNNSFRVASELDEEFKKTN